MKTTRILILLFLILTFLLGLYVTVFHKVTFEKKKVLVLKKKEWKRHHAPIC